MRKSISMVVLAVGLAILCLAGGARAQSESFTRGQEAARVELAKSLVKLAKWCHQKTLYLERDRIYARAIEYDANNKDARQGLGGTRSSDGTWKMPPLKEAKNKSEAALAELPAETAKATSAYRDSLLKLVETEAPDESVKTKVYDEILVWDPDDPRVRKILDQVKVDGNWVMPETAAAKTRRGEIKELAAKVKSEVQAPVKIEPAGADTQLAPSWPAAVGTDGVRVLSTGDVAEAEEIARNCQAMLAFANQLLGTSVKLPNHFTIYALVRPDDKDMFLSRISGLKESERANLRSLTGCGLPGTPNIAVWYADAPSRLDCCVRQSLGHVFRDAFRVTSNCGWVFEGMGLYLTRELIGTRLTWFATARLSQDLAEQHALRALLMVNGTNWMNEASKLLSGDKPPKLEDVMSKDVDHMDMRDMLVAYALSAYLVEGRETVQAAGLVERCGRGEKPESAVKGALGYTTGELQKRLSDWLKERR